MKPFYKITLFIVIALCLFLFARATDWSGVAESLRQVGFNFLFLLGITAVSAWIAAMGWRCCLPKDSVRVSGFQLFWVRMVGENIAILNPASMVGGEASKVYMLTQLGVDQRQALHSIILSRSIQMLSQFLMLLIAGVLFLSLTRHPFSWPAFDGYRVVAILVFIAGLIVVSRSTFGKHGIKKLLQGLRLWRFYGRAQVFLKELFLELRTFYRENRRAMFLSLLLFCLFWIVGSLEFYFILLFLGIKTSVAKALLVDMGVVLFKMAGGLIPGQLGIEEYGNKFMLAIIGVSGGTIWLSASVLRRARQLCWILLGFLVYFIRFYRRI
jgi:uncharacterized protein (TIRG00374 family)